MALKINQLNAQSATGILDGAINFRVTASEDGVTAVISSWTCTLVGRAQSSVSEMRSSAYEVLARYREDQKQSLASKAFSAA